MPEITNPYHADYLRITDALRAKGYRLSAVHKGNRETEVASFEVWGNWSTNHIYILEVFSHGNGWQLFRDVGGASVEESIAAID